MKKEHVLKLIVAFIGAVVFGILLFMANSTSDEDTLTANNFVEYNTGRIVNVLEDDTDFTDSGFRIGRMVFEVEMLGGTFEGQVLEANYFLFSPACIYLEEGARVSIMINVYDGEIFDVEVGNPERSETLIAFILFFLVMLCAIGGKRGILSVLGLTFTIFSIMFLLIPLTLQGYEPILITVVIITLITTVSLTLLGGVTPKTVSAILSCIIGAIISAVFASIIGNIVHISGYHMEDVGRLVHSTGNAIQIRGLFISSLLVAAIGAMMDTSMSIASAMEEVKLTNPDITARRLFKSGFNIGRDVMGTMSNTLILAFVGSSLNIMLIVFATDVSFNEFINNNFIAMEIIKGIAGSVGIILTVPITTFIASRLFTMWKVENMED